MQQVRRILCRIHFNLSFILYIVFGKTDIQHNTSILGYQQSEATIPFPDFMPGKKEKDSTNISRTSFFVLIGKTFICTTTQQSTSLSFTTTLCFGRMYLQWFDSSLLHCYSLTQSYISFTNWFQINVQQGNISLSSSVSRFVFEQWFGRRNLQGNLNIFTYLYNSLQTYPIKSVSKGIGFDGNWYSWWWTKLLRKEISILCLQSNSICKDTLNTV